MVILDHQNILALLLGFRVLGSWIMGPLIAMS